MKPGNYKDLNKPKRNTMGSAFQSAHFPIELLFNDENLDLTFKWF